MKRITLTAALAALILSAASARASTSHFVELQLDGSKMSQAIRDQIESSRTFCPFEIQCPFNGNQTCIVDHFEVPFDGSWSRGTTSVVTDINDFLSLSSDEILFTQPLNAVIKTLQCAETPGCTTVQTFPILVETQASMANGDLCVTPKSIVGAPAGVVPPAIDTCLGLSVETMLAIAGQTGGTVSGQAFTLANGSRLALRAEFGRAPAAYNSARISAWQNFLDGSLSNTGVGGKDWIGFIHESLARSTVKSRITDSLNQQSGLQLTSSVNAGWLPLGPLGVQMPLSFDADVSDTPCPNDISAGVTISTHTGINGAQNGLLLTGGIDYNASDSDLFVCGLTAIGGIFGPLGGILGVAIGNAISVDLSLSSNGCVSDSDGNFTCNEVTHPQSISLGFGRMATAELDTVFGAANGLTMAGPLLLTNAGALNTSVSSKSVSFGLYGNCSSAQCDSRGGFYVQGNAPLCSVEVRGDTLNIFDIEIPSELTVPMGVPVSLKSGVTDSQINQFNSTQPKLSIIVHSAAGVTAHEMPHTPLKTSGDASFVCAALQAKKYADCVQTKVPLWESILGRYTPEWLIDPPKDHVFEIIAASGGFLDAGLVNQLQVQVIRRRGVVHQMQVSAQLMTMMKGKDLKRQEILIDVPQARGSRIQDNVDLVDAFLSNGLSAAIEIDPAILPRGVRGASMDVHFSVDFLLAAAR